MIRWFYDYCYRLLPSVTAIGIMQYSSHVTLLLMGSASHWASFGEPSAGSQPNTVSQERA